LLHQRAQGEYRLRASAPAAEAKLPGGAEAIGLRPCSQAPFREKCEDLGRESENGDAAVPVWGGVVVARLGEGYDVRLRPAGREASRCRDGINAILAIARKGGAWHPTQPTGVRCDGRRPQSPKGRDEWRQQPPPPTMVIGQWAGVPAGRSTQGGRRQAGRAATPGRPKKAGVVAEPRGGRDRVARGLCAPTERSPEAGRVRVEEAVEPSPPQ
jgi:hypothetical protein